MRVRRRPGKGQRGTSLMLVLGIGLLVMGMAALAHQLFQSAVGQSARHLSHEQSLHLAEQGVDETIAALQWDPGYDTDAVFGAMPGGVDTEAEERAWVAAALEAAPAGAVRAAPGGEVVTIKPSGRNVIYSAGYVPSRAAAARTRIVKSEYLPQSTFSPAHALLTGGGLTLSGNPWIGGAGGSVHANGDVQVFGTPTVTGDLTASGELEDTGITTVGGITAGGVPAQDIPAIDPRTVWNRHARSPLYAGSWYDLCPDASVRLPDGAVPCAGTVLAADASSSSYRGWRLSGDSWTVSGNDGSFHGVYYAYQRNMRVSGNPGSSGSPWMVTLIAEALPSGTQGDDCAVLSHGDVEVSGNARLSGFLEGLALMAGRDLSVSGNPTQSLTGVMAAHEQLIVSGNPTLTGALIAEGLCDSPASAQHENVVSGNMVVTYDLDLEVPVGGEVRTTLWLEL